MTATQLPLYQSHYNRQLFADYYLNTVLPARTDWKALSLAQDVHDTFARITAIWRAYQPAPNEKEAQTEEGWIKRRSEWDEWLDALRETWDD
jgi:hypothetical protein